MHDEPHDERSVAPGVRGGMEPERGEAPGTPPRHTVRYSRRRFLGLAGGVIAGVAGAFGLVRLLGGGSSGGSGAGIPNDFPVLHVEPVPQVAASDWVITVDGLVDKPLRIDHATWVTLARRQETADFHCVEGWSVDALRWGGVAPATLLDLAGVQARASSVAFHAYGGTYVDSLSLDQVRDARTLLADTLDGAPLPAGHGGPVRLVIPSQLGYKNVKWVTRLELTATPVRGYWEQRGYPSDAPVG